MIKQLIGTFGGGLYIWDIIHPHRIVSQYKSDVQLPLNKKLNKNDATAYDINEMIQYAIRGPDIQSVSHNPESLMNQLTLDDYRFGTSPTSKKGKNFNAYFSLYSYNVFE